MHNTAGGALHAPAADFPAVDGTAVEAVSFPNDVAQCPFWDTVLLDRPGSRFSGAGLADPRYSGGDGSGATIV